MMCLFLYGQNRSSLEQNRSRIQQEITMINEMLRETQSSAQSSINHLVIINNKIQSRESLISAINNQIAYINRGIRASENEVAKLEDNLASLKESYARMIYYAYRNRNSLERMMFIFASRDFNQAYLRMRYLRQLTRHRHLQAQRIEQTKAQQSEKIAELKEQRSEQQSLLLLQNKEIQQLAQEKQSQNQTIAQLRRREDDLRRQLREQQRAERELQRAIEQVIAEERRRATEAAKAQGRPAAEAFRLAPEDQVISDQFAGNRGRLPWPLERGVITGRFGEQPHPVLPGIKIANNGIDISTTQGSRARAIFQGTVSRVVSIPGANFAIIIRHGEYLTVYANIAEVFVRTGQKVNIRQELGTIATDSRDARTHLRLEIWHGNTKLNPAEWIVQQR